MEQREIYEKYKKYELNKPELKNKCDILKAKFTNTQKFIPKYMEELIFKKNENGMLLYHSVGSGKTCTAILTAAKVFEKKGYDIRWVTRSSLKTDFYKNLISSNVICHPKMKKYLNNEENKSKSVSLKKRMLNKITNKQWKQPMSYKMFTNFLKKSNKTIDPLKKTLIIIDEAHNLYGPFLSSHEKPDILILEKAIKESYNISGKDSVKLLLLSATPAQKNSTEGLQLLNLLKKNNTNNLSDFDKHISFLDKSKDPGFFTSETNVDDVIKISTKLKCTQKQIKNSEYCEWGMDFCKEFDKLQKQNDSNNTEIITNKITELKQKKKGSKKDDKVKYDKAIADLKILKENYLTDIKNNKKKIKDLVISEVSTCKNKKKSWKSYNNIEKRVSKCDTKIKKDTCKNKYSYMPRPRSLYEFDNKKYNKEVLDLPLKIQKLVSNINELDNKDIQKHGRTFKHAIFSRTHVKSLIGFLIKSNFKLLVDYENMKLQTVDKNRDNYNMLTLFDKTVYKKSQPKKLITSQLKMYNERPGNIYGDKARFIVFDEKYTEGIDLYDVKYLHILQEPSNNEVAKQIKGRAKRFCGQKGLDFDKETGWNLHVYKYTINVNDVNIDTLILNDDNKLDKFISDLQNISIDKLLTNKLHNFE